MNIYLILVERCWKVGMVRWIKRRKEENVPERIELKERYKEECDGDLYSKMESSR